MHKLSLTKTTPFDAPRCDYDAPLGEVMSKRRRGFPSETRVKAGLRVVHGNKVLIEKLGRNDQCPCGSGQRFKRCCLRSGRF